MLEKHFVIIDKEIQKVHSDEAKERKIMLLEIENMILKLNQSPKSSREMNIKGTLMSKSDSDKQ